MTSTAVYKGDSMVEWGTPPELFDRLAAVWDFTLDPCASESNHKCDRYYTKETDGLAHSWKGEIVFMNPPYANDDLIRLLRATISGTAENGRPIASNMEGSGVLHDRLSTLFVADETSQAYTLIEIAAVALRTVRDCYEAEPTDGQTLAESTFTLVFREAPSMPYELANLMNIIASMSERESLADGLDGPDWYERLVEAAKLVEQAYAPEPDQP